MSKVINYSKIRTIGKLKAIQPFIENLNKDRLIIFDIDDVLIMPTPNHYLKHPYRNQLWHEIKQHSSQERIRLLKFNIMKNTKYRLVDPYTIYILNYLKKHFVPTIALTSLSTGKVDNHHSIEALRIRNLNEFGVSFEELTPMQGISLATELAGKYMVFPECIGFPMIKAGIIFTAGVDKSIVLNYMFNKYNYYPKTILFIDDDLKNLTLVKHLCNKLHINFYGFHYTAASQMPMPNINKAFEKLRFKTLEANQVWLNSPKINKFSSL